MPLSLDTTFGPRRILVLNIPFHANSVTRSSPGHLPLLRLLLYPFARNLLIEVGFAFARYRRLCATFLCTWRQERSACLHTDMAGGASIEREWLLRRARKRV